MNDVLRQVAGALGLRAPARRAKDWLLAALGSPQAYADLAVLARQFPDITYLDIGCHRGDTVQRFLDVAGAFPVVAFDPSEQNLEFARRKVGAGAAVKFVRAAVADEDGQRAFFANANEQTSSLLPNAAGNLRSFPQDTRTIATPDVAVVRLDTWAAAELPSGRVIVKCDTQGAEAKVVRGGLRFMREQAIAFYGEVMLDGMYEGQATFQELRDLLEGDCGMVLRNLYPCLHDREGRAVQFDALWVQRSLLNAFK
jgi:FkbM family methyltransferase